MLKFLKMCFGLKGSFRWALRQMKAGRIVTHRNITGAVKYRFDLEGQYRIQWAFTRNVDNAEWENANIFMDDVYSIDWIIWNSNKSENESQHSQPAIVPTAGEWLAVV